MKSSNNIREEDEEEEGGGENLITIVTKQTTEQTETNNSIYSKKQSIKHNQSINEKFKQYENEQRIIMKKSSVIEGNWDLTNQNMERTLGKIYEEEFTDREQKVKPITLKELKEIRVQDLLESTDEKKRELFLYNIDTKEYEEEEEINDDLNGESNFIKNLKPGAGEKLAKLDISDGEENYIEEYFGKKSLASVTNQSITSRNSSMSSEDDNSKDENFKIKFQQKGKEKKEIKEKPQLKTLIKDHSKPIKKTSISSLFALKK